MKTEMDKKEVRGGRIPARETAAFCAQASMLLQAGIPLGEGLPALVEEGTGSGRDILKKIADTVADTGSLYEGVKNAGVFPAYMVRMVRIGETVGKLEEVLVSLSAFYEREDKLRASVRSAVLYPIVLILLMAAVVAVLVIAVLPIFSQVLSGLGAESGLNTGLVTVGVTIGRCVLAVAAVLLLLLVVLFILSLIPSARAKLLVLSGHLPVLKKIYRQMASGRFASVMSMMLSSGYNLNEALELAEEVVSDHVVSQKVRQCRELVGKGTSFSDALLELNLFSGLHTRMIQTGEKAGRLDEVMKKMAVQYEEETDASLNWLVSLIEPTLVIILSVIIGSILLSVMLPLINIMSVIG